MVPPLIVTPDSVSVSALSILMMLVVALASVMVSPVTVTSSSVSVTPLSTLTTPSFRLALLSIVLKPVT